MIKVTINKRSGFIYRFKVISHGDPVVCAGVSALVISTVNFIKSELKAKSQLKYEHDGGMVEFAVIDSRNEATALLLNHMLFGLEQIQENYPKDIRIQINDD